MPRGRGEGSGGCTAGSDKNALKMDGCDGHTWHLQRHLTVLECKFHIEYYATIEKKKKPARHAPGERAKSKWGKQETVWRWGQGWKRSPEKEASEQWEARV